MENNNIFSDAGRLRREMGEKSLQAFAELFFPHYLKQKMCPFHKEFYTTLEDVTEKRGERVANAAPRNAAKSAIASLIFPLWCICYRKERYIVIVSDTRDQAEAFLSHIKDELEKNEKLIESFPDICEIGQKPSPSRWTRSEIVTRNDVLVTALGSNQKIRGRRNREIRPSLIILDDIENDTNTQSEESRQKLFNWFTKAVLKAGSPTTNVIVVGTLQHFDSLLAKLIDEVGMPGWRKRVYKSVIVWAINTDLWQKWAAIFNNRESYKSRSGKEAAYDFYVDNKDAMLEGTQVLWPEREDYYSLMLMREQEAPGSFDSEKQNEPVSSRESLFNPETFRYWSDNYRSTEELLQYLGNNAQFFGSCDPSGGESISCDYSAIIILVRDKRDGALYVIEADIKRRTPDETMNDILAYRTRYKFEKFAVEGNYFQTLMVTEMERRSKVQGSNQTFTVVKNTSSKYERIQTLQPLIKNGTILFNRLHKTLIEQLKYFPKAKYDDGPDGLHLAVAAASEPQSEFMFWFGDLPGSKSIPRGGSPLTLPADGTLVPYGWRPIY